MRRTDNRQQEEGNRVLHLRWRDVARKKAAHPRLYLLFVLHARLGPYTYERTPVEPDPEQRHDPWHKDPDA